MIGTRLILVAMACLGTCVLLPRDSTSAPVPKDGTIPYTRWMVIENPVTNEMHNPLVVKDLVVVGTDKGDLRAFRVNNGEAVWTYKHGKRIYHKPASDGERIYFSTDLEISAVTADAGDKVWSFNLSQCDGPVLVLREKGLVYTADHTGTLYALDAKTGEKKWTADFAADAPPDPPGFSGNRARFENCKARPNEITSDGEIVFLSVFDQCRVVAFDALTGKRKYAIQTRGWTGGSATATSKHVFVGSQDKHLYCVDKKTGKELWKFETKGRVESGGVADDNYVYFGSCDGALYCLSHADGKERWRFDTDRHPDGNKSSIYSVPVLRQGFVCFAAGEGQFYAVTADTGNARGRLRPEEKSHIYCSAATDGRSFFITTRPRIGGNEKPVEGVSALVAISLK